MTPEAFEIHCLSLPATTKVVQWGGASVFRVGGKIFAIANGFLDRYGGGLAFKASDIAYELLIEAGLARPAPSFWRAKWVTVAHRDALSDAELVAYLNQAHALVAAQLTRPARRRLGLR